MKGWLATVLGGIVTAVVAAVLISSLGGNKSDTRREPSAQHPTERPRSLLDRVAGKYTFDNWRSLQGEQVILRPRSGTLSIASDGGVEMDVRMEPDYGQVSERNLPLYCIYTCHGVVSISDQRIKFGHCQGAFPNGLPQGMEGPQATPAAMAALRSSDLVFGKGDPGYAFALDEGATATHLQWTNDAGILTWTRVVAE